jgi:hypothetical protein
MNTETSQKNILLVEDDPRDAELTLAALEEHHLANKVFVVHDGAEALDYLYCRGKFKGARRVAIPWSCCSTTRCRRSTGWKC